jgi:hypothetical protein
MAQAHRIDGACRSMRPVSLPEPPSARPLSSANMAHSIASEALGICAHRRDSPHLLLREILFKNFEQLPPAGLQHDQVTRCPWI